MNTPELKFEEMLKSGEITFPTNHDEMMCVLARYKYVIEHEFDMDKEFELFKILFVRMHRVKSGSKKYCYISAIKQGVMTNKFRTLSDIILSLHGIDLMTYAIQRLIVEDKIALSRKKVFLVNQ
jgi:hypothetical protein